MQIRQLIVGKFLRPSITFTLLGSNILLSISQSMLLLQSGRPSFTPIYNNK